LQKNNKHIVLITTWFPPRKGVAVNRMNAFVKYLDSSKYKISVITLRENNAPQFEIVNGINIFRLRNNSVLHTLQEKAGEFQIVHNLKVLWNVILTRFKTFEYLNWKELAVKKLFDLHSIEKIDLIISSYSPVEPHLVALEFCKVFPEIKWIADMRDEMSRNPYISYKQRNILKEVENKINLHASAIISVSEPILFDFLKLMPSVKYYEEIRNGFDHNITVKNNFNDTFTISYAGTFYGLRKPTTFFQGLKNFIYKSNAKVKLQFIGTNKNFAVPKDIKRFCKFIPMVSNQEALEMISESDANLLVLPNIGTKGVYSRKIFDYISVMKPIIAVVDSTDVAAKLILEYNAGFVADFNDITQIETAIALAYNLWKEKKLLPMNKEKIESLHIKHQIKKLEKLIDKLLSK
jgi:hypothetical protein